MIAAGLGCRVGCSPEDVVRALAEALRDGAAGVAEVQALYSADFKRGEEGLSRAAEELGKPLVLLPLEELRAHAGAALTRSARVMERFDLPSIAEAAALAGAALLGGPGATARLLGPRRASGGATCALAISELRG